MQLPNSIASCFPKRRYLLARRDDAALNSISERVEVARRHEPTVFLLDDQFRYSGNKRADNGALESHRLHDDYGQAFRKARKYKGAGPENFVANLFAAYPTSDADF